MSEVNCKTEYLLNNYKSDKSLEIIIAKVTNCLSSHEQCTGRYIDYSLKHVIVCHCHCHGEKQIALGSVEGPAANAIDSTCHHMESSKDD